MISHMLRKHVTNTSRVLASSKAFAIPSSRWFSDVTEDSKEEKTIPETATAAAANAAAAEAAAAGLRLALTPTATVEHLDSHIIGQTAAKRAVAVALRNRWRRHHLPEEFRNEVIPKNILMIGPTGCGKTEIARRIASLCQAPFIKVEATKYTEVGFHGKDVDQIIRDLIENAITLVRKQLTTEKESVVNAAVNAALVDALIGPHATSRDKERYMELLLSGGLEDSEVEIDVPSKPGSSGPDAKGGNAEGPQIAELVRIMKAVNLGGAGGKTARRKMTVAEARPILAEVEMEKTLDTSDVNRRAVAAVEETGIVFIDEIDKLISGDARSPDASSEGVQRDLLPLIEGSVISTKYGNVKTDFILFIASGAFQAAKPSDLLAELQGRLPIRVTLEALSENDLYRVLTEPRANLVAQQIEMMKTEGVELSFTPEAIREIARVSFQTNKSVENIGARRLHTVMERVVEELSFSATERSGENIVIDEQFVKERLNDMVTTTDLRKYIL